MTELIERLDKIFPLSDDCKFYLLEKLQEHQIPQRDFLVKMHTICRRVYFVEKGIVYGHRIMGAHEICTQIIAENRLCFAGKSFYSQTPSEEALQVLEKSLLYSLSFADYQNALKIFPEFQFVILVHLQTELADSQERLYTAQALSEHGRYEWLLHKHPDFIQRLPAQYLANYIGVTLHVFNQSKSRITPRRPSNNAKDDLLNVN